MKEKKAAAEIPSLHAATFKKPVRVNKKAIAPARVVSKEKPRGRVSSNCDEEKTATRPVSASTRSSKKKEEPYVYQEMDADEEKALRHMEAMFLDLVERHRKKERGPAMRDRIMLLMKTDEKPGPHGEDEAWAFQYNAAGKGGSIPHGAQQYYQEQFPWDTVMNAADEISLYDAREDFVMFDERSFMKRKDDWDPICHLPPNDGNPATCGHFYSYMESEVWTYAGDAFNGMAQQAYARPAAEIASEGLTKAEVIEIFKKVYKNAPDSLLNGFLRRFGERPFPDSHLVNKIPEMWRTGQSSYANPGQNRAEEHMSSFFSDVPASFTEQPEW